MSCQAIVYQGVTWLTHCLVICHALSCSSTPLVSCQAKVYQSLARFIHWTDSLLVSPQASFDKDSAREIIDTLSSGIKVLVGPGNFCKFVTISVVDWNDCRQTEANVSIIIIVSWKVPDDFELSTLNIKIFGKDWNWKDTKTTFSVAFHPHLIQHVVIDAHCFFIWQEKLIITHVLLLKS